MQFLRYIWSLLLLLSLGTQAHAQYINIVCTGDSGVVYQVQGHEGSTYNWRVEGGDVVSDWGDSIAVQWGMLPGEYNISVQETSKYGCPAVPVSGKVNVSAPVIDLGPDREVCRGETVEIDASGHYYSWKWQNGSVRTSLITGSEGYKVVTVSDQYGCLASDSIYLTVHDLPRVDLGPDTSLCGIEQLLVDAGSDGVLFQWSTGDNQREILLDQGRKEIWVEVTDENNCVNYDSLLIHDCSPTERFAMMPTAFTPNGDGRNDTWRIPELEPFPNAVVEIFDRWGNLIYRSEPGYSRPWDGYASNGRQMPMDSYYFVIDLGHGIKEQITGTVTIIK